jgi:hypothetical protein
VFQAKDGVTVEKTLLLHEAEKDRHERIVFEPVAPSGVPAAPNAGAPEGPGMGLHAGTVAPVAQSGNWPRTLGLVVGGVGVASIATGSVLGLIASSRWSQSQKECSPSGCPNFAGAISDHDGAANAGNLSTAAFVAGGVLVAAGVALVIASPAKSSPSKNGWVVSPTFRSGKGELTIWSRF